MSNTRARWTDGPRNTYFVTSDRGLFRCDPTGLHQVADIHLYGCTIVGPKVFMGFYIDRLATLVEGNAAALFSPGTPFEFREIFSEITGDDRERIHQITSCGEIVWLARTRVGAVLRYDTSNGRLTNYTLIRDRFNAPIRLDVNHINSVIQYGDVVLFTGTHAGDQSIVGVLDGNRVTGFGYKNLGVHDVYLTPSGFLFFDTFGPDRPDEGGAPVTEKGVLFPEIFSKPPGYVLRGAAQTGEEIVFGSSHKGERTQRFKGKGELLIIDSGKLGPPNVSPAPKSTRSSLQRVQCSHLPRRYRTPPPSGACSKTRSASQSMMTKRNSLKSPIANKYFRQLPTKNSGTPASISAPRALDLVHREIVGFASPSPRTISGSGSLRLRLLAATVF